MNKQEKYWFFLEPYAFIFKGNSRTIVYNTLNSAYITCPQNKTVEKLIEALDAPESGYCTEITNKDLEDVIFSEFIDQLRNSFSGDWVNCFAVNNKPYIFKPILRLRDNFHRVVKNSTKEDWIGINILSYLSEVSLYITLNCDQSCKDCFSYYRQFPYCTRFDNMEELSLEMNISILNKLEESGIKLVNILGGDIFKYKYWGEFLKMLSNYKFKKRLFIHYKNVTQDLSHLAFENNFEFIILIDTASFDKIKFTEAIQWLNQHKAEFLFTVESEADLMEIEKLINEYTDIKTEFKPLFNGSNIDFFEKYVYNNLEDIINTPVDKKKIFRRQIVNENFFGKLIVFPNGDVYSNMNKSSIGNIFAEDSFNKIVFREIDGGEAWLNTRKNGICGNCCNKYLCPSPSNYELVLGKNNLCHFQQ